jgi:hypothetical protein
METNFFVGQEVVAIKDHSQGTFKKGNEFVIRGIKEDCCLITLDVGIRTGKGFMNCRFCGNRKENDDYFDSNCFSPKQELSQLTYDELQKWFKEDMQLTL